MKHSDTRWIKISLTGAFCLLTSLMQAQSKASDTLRLSGHEDLYNVEFPHLRIIEDTTGKVDFEAIHSGRYDSLFQKSAIGQPIITRPERIYWGKLTILNDREEDRSWILEFVDFKVDELEVYIPDVQGRYHLHKSGDAYAFRKKRYRHKNFVYPLPSVYAKPYTVYIKTRVLQQQPFFLFGKIRSHENFTAYSLNEYFLLALFYGIILSMILYNLFLYMNTKAVVHFVYTGYIAGLAIFSLSYIDGLGFQYLWPSLPELNEYLAGISKILFISGALAFAAYFLETYRLYPKIHKLLITAIVTKIGIGLTILYFPALEFLQAMDLFFLSLIAWPAYLSFRRKELVTRHYLISFLLMFVGFLVYISQDYRLIPNTIIGYYSLNLGIVGEVIFLSLAITEKNKLLILQKNHEQQEKIRHLKENEALKNTLIDELREKEKLKDIVNSELEAKVAERTDELKKKATLLEELNAKLEVQTQEINRMASLLDKQNWELKKELKNEALARVSNAMIDYQEFSLIFPDEHSCLTYISNLKWTKGYKCRKCGNDKYSQKRSDLSRKCTRCSHIESVTNSTLFHGVRFPLQKAFYIAYLAMHGEKSNLLKIAEQLEVRPATCRRFFNSVREKKNALQTMKNGREITSLETMIV